MSSSAPSLIVRQLGLLEYSVCYERMRNFTGARDKATPDELWVVEHPPVYTLGLAADRSHLLALESIAEQQIPVIQTDRGGEVTYHGPGQVVVYLLLDLRRYKPEGKFFVRELVSRIEQAVINVLQHFGIRGERKPGAPGIYLPADASPFLEAAHADANIHPADLTRWQGAKIAALGLKIRGTGCTYHGLSLNVGMDLRPFGWINPCGYAGLATVDMASLGVHAGLHEVQALVVAQLRQLLRVEPAASQSAASEPCTSTEPAAPALAEK